MPASRNSHRLPAALAVMALPILGLGACVAAKPNEAETAMLALSEQKSILPAPRTERDAIAQHDLLTQAAFWGREHDKNPTEYEAALEFSRVLRAIGSSARAAEVSGQALAMKPGDVELAIVHAQASLDIGRASAAAATLARAEANGQTNWRFLSIVGVTMDQLGSHAGAQDYYLRALVHSPDNSRVLSNLGLSYALEGKTALAEETLRRAATLPNPDPRVRQNLALVLGVQGKFDEAERVMGAETPRSLVEANSAYYRALLTPARSWDGLRGTSN